MTQDKSYRGVEFHVHPMRLAWQKLRPSQALSTGARSLQFCTRSAPRVDGNPKWVAIKPLLSGICGSDLSLLRARSSPYLAPLTSWPAVLGHEVVGEIATPDAPWPLGTRVVIDPSLACEARGLPLCLACARGEPDECANRHDSDLGAGMLLGYHRDLPGGWSTTMWAPVKQIFPIPYAMKTRRAVLVEPAAIVLQGLSRVFRLAADSRVLVLGAGTVGLLTVWLLKETHGTPHISVHARYPHQARMASQLGAATVYQDNGNAGFVTNSKLRAIVGTPYPTQFNGWPYLPYGFDLIVDTIGSQTSFYEAATLVRPGGQILLLGGAGRMSVDFAPIWSRRITLLGSFGYGHAAVSDASTTFQSVINRLHETTLPIENLVTHAIPLNRYEDAFKLLGNHEPTIKVALSSPTPSV